MDIKELVLFVKSLTNLEDFMFEIAAREPDFFTISRQKKDSSISLSQNISWPDDVWRKFEKAKPAIEEFERKLFEVVRVARILDKDLGNKIERISASSNIAKAIAQLEVIIEIKDKRNQIKEELNKPISYFLKFIEMIFNNTIYSRTSFNEENISINEMLISFKRLIPLSKEVINKYYSYRHENNEVFKPANVNIENIDILITSAINEIKSSPEIGGAAKKKLIEYLEETKVELASDTPLWKKIVGALVIVSTILGGLAVVPQASENIESAINYILGLSVDKKYKSYLPNNTKAVQQLLEV